HVARVEHDALHPGVSEHVAPDGLEVDEVAVGVAAADLEAAELARMPEPALEEKLHAALGVRVDEVEHSAAQGLLWVDALVWAGGGALVAVASVAVDDGDGVARVLDVGGEALLGGTQCLRRLAVRRHVLDSALVEEHVALLVERGARVLA